MWDPETKSNLKQVSFRIKRCNNYEILLNNWLHTPQNLFGSKTHWTKKPQKTKRFLTLLGAIKSYKVKLWKHIIRSERRNLAVARRGKRDKVFSGPKPYKLTLRTKEEAFTPHFIKNQQAKIASSYESMSACFKKLCNMKWPVRSSEISHKLLFSIKALWSILVLWCAGFKP